MSSESPTKPRLRIIHQMARSGGTVICKCLASMQGVVLLSEIHPDGLKMFNPLQQADDWYSLLTDEDAREFRASPPNFVQAIQRIYQRASQKGLSLLLRDWSHLDYTGVPFQRPSFGSRLAETLQPHFELIRHYTVRHPLDQWLSITRNPGFRQHLAAEDYLQGVARFAEAAETHGYSRYEDFTQDPESTLRRICTALELEFDPGYAARWASYRNITGDVLPGRAGGSIQVLPRQEVEAEVLESAATNPVLPLILDRLSYTAEGV